MQTPPDVPLELSAVWRRVALLEEDSREKAAQIAALLQRLDRIEMQQHRSPSSPPTSASPRSPIADTPDASTVQADSDPDIPLVDLTPDDAAPAARPRARRPPPAYLHLPAPDNGADHDPIRDRDAIAALNAHDDNGDDDAPAAADAVDAGQYDLVRDLDLQPLLDGMPSFLSARLYLHQRIGAVFLSGVLRQNAGAIFADALGLGKTLQVLSALYMFCSGDAHKMAKPKLLILTPLTVVPHWANEVVRFNSWLPPGVKPFADPYRICSTMSPSFRTDVLERWAGTGGLLILSYSMFMELAGRKRDSRLLRVQPGPDVVVLDEGHRICNDKSAIHSSLNVLRTQRRIVVSGYPLQNHLRELYSLMNYVNKAKCTALFKSRQNFIYLYEKVINSLRQTKPEISKKRAFVLYEIIRRNRLFFRRDNQFLKQYLPRKTEIVLTLRFSELQRSVWMDCLEKRTSLDGITLHSVATMIADHPEIARRQVDLEADNPYHETLSGLEPGRVDLDASGKMIVLMLLLQLCRAAGEKVVVFTRWIKALSFVEEMVERYNEVAAAKINVYRVDGGTASDERQTLIRDFNSSSTEAADCFLISTLCGEGISLVAASRVVILEPSWNPSIDFQAAYRVYRIGQTRPVFIYRLLMGDMFEDMVFQRQLEKIEASSWVMDASSKEVAHRVATQWSEFIKAPPALEQLSGPTRISLSDFALNDSITAGLVGRLSLLSPSSFAEAPQRWIQSAVEHSKYFDEHAEVRQAPDLDSAMAFEELEYDRVYTQGTPVRDSTLIDNVKRLTSVSVVDVEMNDDDDYDDANLIVLSTDSSPAHDDHPIPESCLKPLQADPIADAAVDNEDDEKVVGHPPQPPSEDESWHAAVSLPMPARQPAAPSNADGDRLDWGRRLDDAAAALNGVTALPEHLRDPDAAAGDRLGWIRRRSQSIGRRSDAARTDAAQDGVAAPPDHLHVPDDALMPSSSSRSSQPAPGAGKRRFEPVKCVDRHPKARRPNAPSRGVDNSHRRSGEPSNGNARRNAASKDSSRYARDSGPRRYENRPPPPPPRRRQDDYHPSFDGRSQQQQQQPHRRQDEYYPPSRPDGRMQQQQQQQQHRRQDEYRPLSSADGRTQHQNQQHQNQQQQQQQQGPPRRQLQEE